MDIVLLGDMEEARRRRVVFEDLDASSEADDGTDGDMCSCPTLG